MGVFIMISQLILSLSILVILHEMGHFFPAKWFKTRVEKFYLFFNPWFSLFKVKRGETEYGIGWLPLGGYVKIAGMVDESLDTAQLQQEPQPWEFRSKPAWQRLVIMLGGVTVNFILGFLIFSVILFVWGETYLPNENVKYGIHVDSTAYEMGLRDGDKVVSIGDRQFVRFNSREVIREIVINNASEMVVEREGRQVAVSIDPKYIRLLSSSDFKNEILFEPRVPYVIQELIKDYPAAGSGLQVGDQIIALNSEPTPYWDVFLTRFRSEKFEEVAIRVDRGGEELDFTLRPRDGLLGIVPQGPIYFFETARQNYTLMASIPAGFSQGWNFLFDQIKAFGQMFKGKIKASESLGGFGTITNLFPKSWNWESFWRVTAILSLILGFMNLLPIPALDGGHVMFLLYEVVSGRKPSDKFMEYATIVGFAVVIALVLYANGLDVLRYFRS